MYENIKMFVLLIKLLTKSKTLTEIVYCLLFPRIHKTLFLFVCLLVFYATFNNISVISWRSVLLVEETGRPWEKHRPVESHWQTLSHNVVHIALIEIWTHNISGDTHWLHCKSNYHTVFVCPFVLLSFFLLLVIVLYVLLRFTDSDLPLWYLQALLHKNKTFYEHLLSKI
jgi:hypothetical protein